MNPQNPNAKDWIDDALRHEQRYIDDAGFSASVVATLPRRKKRAQLRVAILVGACVMGSALGLFVFGGDTYLVDSVLRVLQLRTLSSIPVALLLMIAGIFWATYAAVTSES